MIHSNQDNVQKSPDNLEQAILVELHQINLELQGVNNQLRLQENLLIAHSAKGSKTKTRSQIAEHKSQITRIEKRRADRLVELNKVTTTAQEHEKYMAMMRIKELEIKLAISNQPTLGIDADLIDAMRAMNGEVK